MMEKKSGFIIKTEESGHTCYKKVAHSSSVHTKDFKCSSIFQCYVDSNCKKVFHEKLCIFPWGKRLLREAFHVVIAM